MQTHTEGYVTQFPYTYGYFAELNPRLARFQFLEKGIAFPAIRNACEIGYGLGVSLNIHAAASTARWWGTDFNPDQAAFAQALADASQVDAVISAEDFAGFCRRPDLPQFDFIGMHGIWSWVSEESRGILLEFVKKHLAVGGILYISYNTVPGWNSLRPLRDLMALYMECAPAPDMREGIRNAIGFARRFLDVDSRFSADFPELKPFLAEMSRQGEAYLAHEYFNKDWDCASFAQMHAMLSQAGLHYVCQPSYLESVDVLNLGDEQMGFLQKVSSPVLRETLIDFFQERKFRRDYWIRGRRELSYVELCENLFDMSFIPMVAPKHMRLKAVGAQREAELNENLFAPLLEVFNDGEAHSVFEIMKNVAEHLELRQLLHALNILCSNGSLTPACLYDEKMEAQCRRLNTFMEGFAISGEKISHLASPVLGGGVKTSRIEQIFILAMENGCQSEVELAHFAIQQMTSSRKFPGTRSQEPVPLPEELADMAAEFIKVRLPLLQRLKICRQ